jgi:hypothetical protein
VIYFAIPETEYHVRENTHLGSKIDETHACHGLGASEAILDLQYLPFPFCWIAENVAKFQILHRCLYFGRSEPCCIHARRWENEITLLFG